MEGFTYTNIFETKGIEYLVIISFFAVLVPVWAFFNRKPKSAYAVQKAKAFISAGSFQIPQGIFFSRYHTWAHLEKDGKAKVGMDDLLLHLTGTVTVDHYKSVGEFINKGEIMARIHYNGNSLEVVSPVSGKIDSTNELLSKEPDLIRIDPYQNGWIYSLKPLNWKADTNSCYLAEDATEWAKNELLRFKDFLAVSTSRTTTQPSVIVMQDGGEIMEKALVHFPQEVWQEFQETFLT